MSTGNRDDSIRNCEDPILPTGDTFDPTVLAALRADLQDDEFVFGLAQRFLIEAPGRIAVLAAAVQEEDSRAIGATAHLIKGSALTFGATRLANLCAALETSPLGRRSLVAAVAHEFTEFSRCLTSYLGNVR